jgi:hypothetical protein
MTNPRINPQLLRAPIIVPSDIRTVGLAAKRDLFSRGLALAARYRFPAILNQPSHAESGGLIAYGTEFVELFRQAAEYIDRILKGAKPGELPIKYELATSSAAPDNHRYAAHLFQCQRRPSLAI